MVTNCQPLNGIPFRGLENRDVSVYVEGRSRCRQARNPGRDSVLLLLLVTVHAQALFALVCSHLVAFTFFSAGHFRVI